MAVCVAVIAKEVRMLAGGWPLPCYRLRPRHPPSRFPAPRVLERWARRLRRAGGARAVPGRCRPHPPLQLRERLPLAPRLRPSLPPALPPYPSCSESASHFSIVLHHTLPWAMLSPTRARDATQQSQCCVKNKSSFVTPLPKISPVPSHRRRITSE